VSPGPASLSCLRLGLEGLEKADMEKDLQFYKGCGLNDVDHTPPSSQ
jgi:hypothetical protein